MPGLQTASQQLLPQQIIIVTINALSNALLPGGARCPSPLSLPLTLLLAQSCPVDRERGSAAGSLLAKSCLTLARGERSGRDGFVPPLSPVRVSSDAIFCSNLAFFFFQMLPSRRCFDSMLKLKGAIFASFSHIVQNFFFSHKLYPLTHFSNCLINWILEKIVITQQLVESFLCSNL